MDDLLLFTPLKVSHGQIERFIKGIVEEWITDFPKECQLFKTNLQYTGNEIFIQNKRVCVQPLRSSWKLYKSYSPLPQ